MFVSHPVPNSYVKTLTLNVVILGDGAFERQLEHEGRALTDRISALIRETPESSLDSSAM